MFLEAVVLGILVGLVRKGSLDNLKTVRFQGAFLILLSCLIQGLPFVLNGWKLAENKFFLSTPIAVGLLFIVLFLNFKKRGIALITIGTGFNFAAILLNNMKMPISFEGLYYAGFKHMIDPIKMGEVVNYIGYKSAWGFSGYLGKIIPLPSAYMFSKVLSVGDILITIGVFILVQNSMKRSSFGRRSVIVRPKYKWSP